MQPSKFFAGASGLFIVFWSGMVLAQSGAELPIRATAEQPALLLELGNQPASLLAKDSGKRIIGGQISGHQGDTAIESDADEIRTLHPGFGRWKADFRFTLDGGFKAGPHVFWARWRQGGDPSVCMQSFEVWAGPDVSRLEKRATLALRPKGWDYAWIAGESPVVLRPDDKIVEIRNDGAGHDAKVFDAFLLAPPASGLPVAAGSDLPLVLLELGKEPMMMALAHDRELRVFSGTAQPGEGAQSLLTEKDEVQIFHQGFGDWGGQFRFELSPGVDAGQYRFYARYKSGGEVSQVEQRFIVKAGGSADQLAPRGEFRLTNNTPWEYQWLEAKGVVSLLPGDRWLEIVNAGKADGAKVFDSFLLKRESRLGHWMSGKQAEARNRFLALTQSIPGAERNLYLLDGKGEEDEILFRGLASNAARQHYQNMSVSYLVGPEAEAMARCLNIATFPAVVIGDDHHTLLGMLSQAKSEQAVVDFLSNPEKFGAMPAAASPEVEETQSLKNGMPPAWLVGGMQDGRGGMSVFGLDTETVLRPNLGEPYLSLQMMGGEMRAWRSEATQADGSVDIEPMTRHAYGWSRGTGYVQLYIRAGQAQDAQLHIKHSGIDSAVWLDGLPAGIEVDNQPPAVFSQTGIQRVKSLLSGLTTEGLVAKAWSEGAQAPQVSTLRLSPGWHSLLIKLTMQHDEGQRFYFAGLMTDSAGRPLDNIETRLTDPLADSASNAIANRLRPLVFADAPANLLHVGDALKLSVDLRWHPILEETRLPAPLPRFQAKLRLRLVDYGGREIAVRETTGLFPGKAEVDFGSVAEPGYYAVYPALYGADGRLIANYPADGFSVIGGSASQKQRMGKKKLWNNDYYALADGDKSFMRQGEYFTWLERMGIFKSYGGYPGFEAQRQGSWEEAKRRGLVFFADSAGDSVWLNDNPKDGENFVTAMIPYTPYFKSSNEIDIRREPEWQKLREPAHWVERAQWEYRQVHQRRNDAHYVGGSLVRPGEGDWFRQVLQLGLDRYQDAWDVHAYPQYPPRFGRPIGNGESEDERGVLAVYASLGRKNSLPFWLGETGAKAMHGGDGRRWQAEQVAKMIAWVNSRSDYLGLAFCIAHEYDLAYGRVWDYSMGHKPGEAALYTAGALIDGLPYRAVDTRDADIQAAYFGETFMVWRSDDADSAWSLGLDPQKSWVVVDVVGRVRDLVTDPSGNASVRISRSPVYVLSRAEYGRQVGR